jgi:hypothetical protein
MNLPHHRRSAAREALEKVHLPHRLAAIEHRLEHRHRGAHKRLVVGALGQAMTLNVIAEIEVGIVLEGRMGEIERHEHQLLPVAMQQMHPVRHVLDEFIVIDGSVEDVERSDMQWARMRFAVNERSVLAGHAMGKPGWRGARSGHFRITPGNLW